MQWNISPPFSSSMGAEQECLVCVCSCKFICVNVIMLSKKTRCRIGHTMFPMALPVSPAVALMALSC